MASHVPFAVIRPEDNNFKRNAASGATLLDYSGMATPRTATRPPAASRISSLLRFPLVLLLSLSINALLYTVVAEYAGFELAAVSRTYTEPWQVGAVLGWKIVELAACWFGGYDSVDVACLTLLANAPYYNLLFMFYKIDAIPVITSALIDTLGSALPFLLLRPISREHILTTPTNTEAPGNALYSDSSIRIYLSMLAAVIYGLIIWASFQTVLPVYMAQHFDGLRSLERAHETMMLSIVTTFLPLGYCAREFLFTPATSTRLVRDTRPVPFDPTTATFAETVQHQVEFVNLSPAGNVLVSRASTLVLYTFANTIVRVFGTVEGVDMLGALRWAGVWSLASASASIALGLCGV